MLFVCLTWRFGARLLSSNCLCHWKKHSGFVTPINMQSINTLFEPLFILLLTFNNTGVLQNFWCSQSLAALKFRFWLWLCNIFKAHKSAPWCCALCVICPAVLLQRCYWMREDNGPLSNLSRSLLTPGLCTWSNLSIISSQFRQRLEAIEHLWHWTMKESRGCNYFQM